MALSSLPIDSLLPRIVETLRSGQNLVLEAEPGAGKTTRVPRALLDSGLLEAGECWVLEPRRLAARLAAARVAEELGEELGRRVGYAVRFEHKISKETRIRFVTEGLLLRRFQEDPGLKGISVVILDEFHERHVHTDVALALLKRLQKTRPELRLVVMSATLDAAPVASFLGAQRLSSPGRAFPVEVRHLRRPDDRPLPLRVSEALEQAHAAGAKGHALVFLPGAAEIRQCLSQCEPTAKRLGMTLLPLHGSLSFEAQKAAVAPSSSLKAILSTNVAESSVTIEGITTVIDSGLGREAQHSPWSGLSSLRTARISQARCVQRAGRAGRTGPGLCLRLFTEAEFGMRAPFDAPELQRSDLAECLLSLAVAGLSSEDLDWFEAPPEAAVEAARRLLLRLGALDSNCRITAMGRAMAALPLHPRLARLVVASDATGIPNLGRLATALLEVGDLRYRAGLERSAAPSGHVLDSDLWARLDAYHEAEAADFAPGACRAAGLDAGSLHQARQAFRALKGHGSGEDHAQAEEQLLMALLQAYPDRVAKAGGGGTFRLVGGNGARLEAASRVREADLILALEADEVVRGTGREVLVRTASRIEPEWLLEAFPEAIRDTDSLTYHPEKDRVERRSGLWFEDLCLDESRRSAKAGEAGVAACLAEALAQKHAAGALGDLQEVLDRMLDRAAFLARTRPDLGLPERDSFCPMLLEKACEGCASLRDTRDLDWAWILREALGPEGAKLLEVWAPDSVQLPKRRVKINYGGEAPWIESRLQDFLGMKEGPRIAGGSIPLVLHLLAPNYRAVQVTTDLAGFWQRAYQELRPALSRRYPRHLWPEHPERAVQD